MLDIIKAGELRLAAPAEHGRPAYLSAASGLVRVCDHLYVISDDEQHIADFHCESLAPGSLIRVFEGSLPAPKELRKKAKRDLEALVHLPASAEHPSGALLAIGSGSRANRQVGVLLRLDLEGSVLEPVTRLDLSSLYRALRERIGELNIEGATVLGQELVLFNRGHKHGGSNVTITLPLGEAMHCLHAPDERLELNIRVRAYDLGNIDGVGLSFTDACALPSGELVFTAVAEDSEDSYRDGRFAGAAVGLIDATGALAALQQMREPFKVEGVHAWIEANDIHLLLVTDPDDASVPSALFRATISR